MKHPLIILSLLALVACSKPVTNTQPSIPADTLLMDIMHAIADSNCSCLDIADEFYMFIDTMQYHAESYPDENIRIGAKSLSMEICNLFMSDMFCTPEEVQFFYDSLITRLVDVQNTWYCNPVEPKDEIEMYQYPVMTQHILFRYGEDNMNHIITLDLYSLPEDQEAVIVTLPMEADSLAFIAFHGEDFGDIDMDIFFHSGNVIQSVPKSDECGVQLLYGREFIDAMLSHKGLFIAYIGDEEGDDLHDCHLSLTRFHEQYNRLK